MRELVAKKYVKALKLSCDEKELEDIYEVLKKLSLNFSDSKFQEIIFSPEVTPEQKSDILLSSLKSANKKVQNFIKILGENRRLDTIEEIAKELRYQIALNKNEFEGKIYSSKKLTQAQIRQLQTKFNQRFDSKVILTQENSNFDGVKVEIEDLGVEIGFSKERLQSQILEHILKAI
jgi:F-type H+-transporting ATPase subunit delta